MSDRVEKSEAVKKGNRVRVTFEAVVYDEKVTRHASCHQLHTDGAFSHFVYMADPNVKVERIFKDAPYWPPVVGDIWEADGVEFFARRNRGYVDPKHVVMTAATGNPKTNSDYYYQDAEIPYGYGKNTLEDFKDLEPRIVRKSPSRVFRP